VEVVPEDPHLMWQTDGTSTEHVQPGEPAAAEEIVDAIVAASTDLDLVGILATGSMFSGFASSRGQRNWDARHGWLMDWCLYEHGDKAVKATLGGAAFDPAPLNARIAADRERLAILRRPPRRLDPGAYRAFLTPAALGEIIGLTGRDGFSHRAHQTHTSSLARLKREEAFFSDAVTLTEHVAGGLGPGFNADGFLKPDATPLIEAGKLVGTLVNPRSASEYDVPTTGAGRWEQPEAIRMDGGELASDDVLKTLGTGLYVSNLWYLNYSDHQRGRITGMTRFATLWVEDGEAVAPIEALRFDDTLFHLLGDGLAALTSEVELLPSASTYNGRSSSSQRLPGALVEGMKFTL
jgi:predicted Zn-dependent protease